MLDDERVQRAIRHPLHLIGNDPAELGDGHIRFARIQQARVLLLVQAQWRKCRQAGIVHLGQRPFLQIAIAIEVLQALHALQQRGTLRGQQQLQQRRQDARVVPAQQHFATALLGHLDQMEGPQPLGELVQFQRTPQQGHARPLRAHLPDLRIQPGVHGRVRPSHQQGSDIQQARLGRALEQRAIVRAQALQPLMEMRPLRAVDHRITIHHTSTPGVPWRIASRMQLLQLLRGNWGSG
ncbi:hypothetical protein G6F68_012092 [Rhizopus microsporus]|nr:hypothetical protein G6F68_012092 [Rhizopus microsporus]